MSDPAHGSWAFLLVGHQWPTTPTLETVRALAAGRSSTEARFGSYAESLSSLARTHLATQEGLTAEDTRRAFSRGEAHARQVASSNAIKARAFERAHAVTSELRCQLAEIADRGALQIDEILRAQQPAAAKIAAIVDVVTAAHNEANMRAAASSQELIGEVQTVLTGSGVDMPARQFAAASGMPSGVSSMPIPTEDLDGQISALMAAGDGAGLPHSPAGSPGADPVTEPTVGTSLLANTQGAQSQIVGSIESSTPSTPAPESSGEALGTPGADDARGDGVNSSSRGRADGIDVRTGVAGPAVDLTMSPRSPDEVADSGPAPRPVEHAPVGGPPAHVAPVPSPEAARPFLPHSAVAEATPGLPRSGASAVAATPPSAPPGPLPPYGADLKSPAATPTRAAPTPAVPSSAPAGIGPAGQQTLIRGQSPSTTAPWPAPATGTTERASATAGTGANASRTAAERRLDRLLCAVARQQPELRWAISDLNDGSTVLVTDLADGWIPAHITIPDGVRLVEPGPRNGFQSVLARAGRTAVHEPGGRLPPDAAPVPMSVRGRDTVAVDDLGWELSRATKWRDGLPRLAHTLAKAACAGTGYLDSEVQLLRDHLNGVARSVLSGYPGSVDSVRVGDWQLLATIDALIRGERTCADYHFAWFSARAITAEGRR